MIVNVKTDPPEHLFWLYFEPTAEHKILWTGAIATNHLLATPRAQKKLHLSGKLLGVNDLLSSGY